MRGQGCHTSVPAPPGGEHGLSTRVTASPEPPARSAAGSPACGTVVAAMPSVPIDEGPRNRRRVGPFWLEEGPGLVVVGAAILAVFAVLYALAVIARPH